MKRMDTIVRTLMQLLLNFLHDLDLSNTYNKSPELLRGLNIFPNLFQQASFLLSQISCWLREKPKCQFVPFYKRHDEVVSEGLQKQVHNLRAKSRTDHDPFQFGRTCPRPGRTLPEVTISWTAQGHTGCTGSGGTWQSVAPWHHFGGP